MAGQNVLIVEDESKIAELLRDYLVAAGFLVTIVERGDLAVAEVRKNAAGTGASRHHVAGYGRNGRMSRNQEILYHSYYHAHCACRRN